jgi:leucyl/phenylalanyl-tRNA--protein transferase
MRWLTLNHGERVRWCDANEPASFIDPKHALNEPAGLVQIGGDLTPEWLIKAYQKGIFPWFSDEDPIMWWSPDPRTILEPNAFKRSRSLDKVIRNAGFSVTYDTAFDEVILACAETRREDGTWIVPLMQSAYRQLHQLGIAHSVEVWRDQRLVGGLYGIAMGNVFFGESMFFRASNASKVALAQLSQDLANCGFNMIDCQFSTDHLRSLGAITISRNEFLARLYVSVHQTPLKTPW